MSKPKAIIFTHPNRLGDTILSLPAHYALAEHFDLTTTVNPHLHFLFANTNITPLALDPKTVRASFQAAFTLRTQRFQYAILARTTLRPALIAAVARIPRRIGNATEGRTLVLTQSLKFDPNQSETERVSDLARCLINEVPVEFPSFTPDPKQDAEAQAKLQGASIGIIPGGLRTDRLIPLETIRQLIKHLTSLGHNVALLGGSDDLPTITDSPALNLVNQCPLSQMPNILANLKAVITPDGGLSHLSRAVGTPTLTFFGPTSATRWGSVQPPHKTIVSPDSNMLNLSWSELAPHLENWEALNSKGLKGR